MERALTEIRNLRSLIHEEHVWGNPSELARIGGLLASYNSDLADNIARLHKEVTDKQARAYRGYKKQGMTDTGAQEQSRFDSVDERERYENIKYVYNATEKLISLLQTSIRTTENQISREGGFNG